jgi:hypothetical protein
MRSKPNVGTLLGCRRFSLPHHAARLLLIAYATAVILLATYPWNVLLLTLLFGRAPGARSTLRSQPSKVRECSNRANPLSVAIAPFQSLRILPRPDAIDRRDPSKSRGV